MTTFPEGWRCPEALREMYPDIERRVYPAILHKSRALHRSLPSIGVDDAIQEGRLALLGALLRYDYNKAKGGLVAYASRVLTNAYLGLVYHELAQCRTPFVIVTDADGNAVKRPLPLLSLDDMLAWDGDGWGYEPAASDESPEVVCSWAELDAQAKRMKLRLLNTLTGLDKKVFTARCNPSVELLKMIKNSGGDASKEVPSIAIARYLGVTKNTVDWSLHKIRLLFTKMAKYDSEFSELFGEAVAEKGWPVIHISKAPYHDHEFVAEVIERRGLDPRPIPGYAAEPDHFQAAGEWSRMIERYEWGVVLVLGKGKLRRTLVLEGKFNALLGVVYGADGAREKVPVGWYGDLVKRLKEGQE